MTVAVASAVAAVSVAAIAAAAWAVGAHVPVRNRVRRWRHGGFING